MTKIQTKDNSSWLTLLCVAILSIIITFVGNPVIPIPIDSHFFVSTLGRFHFQDLYVGSVYNLMRAPIYYIISPLFMSAKLYIVTTYLCSIIQLVVFYSFCRFLTRSQLISFITILLINPLSIRIALHLFEIFQLGGVSVAIRDFITIIYPFHFGWITTFTVRALSGILYIITIYFFVKERYVQLCFALFLIFLIHPNNGLAVSALYILAMMYLLVFRKIPLKYSIMVFATVLLGIIPGILKLYNLNLLQTGAMPNEDWYSVASRINPDNFSALYYIRYHSAGQFIALLIPTLIAIIFLRKKNLTCYQQRLAILCFAPQFLFFGSLFLEILVKYFNLGFLAPLVISGQLGLKSCELAFFPLVGLCLTLWKIEDNKSHYHIIFGVTICILFFFLFRVLSGHSEKMNYKASVYKSLFMGKSNFHDMIKYNLGATYVGYYSQSGSKNIPTSSCLMDVVTKISKHVPNGSMIIVPPSENDRYRSLLFKYKIYFQEYPDFSLLLGSPVAAKIFSDRFHQLFNMDLMSLPEKRDGMISKKIIQMYDTIPERNLDKFRVYKMSDHVYFLSYSKENYSYPVVIKNHCYKLYKIN